MYKNFNAILLTLAMIFAAPAAQAFNACRDAEHYVPLAKRNAQSFLFKIEKCGIPASYILGTIHLARPGVIHSASGAFALLDKVQEAGFEIAEPMDAKMAEVMSHYIFLPKGETLSSKIGKHHYDKLAKLLDENAAPAMLSALDHMKPWAAAVMLELTGEEHGKALDEQLKHAAMKKHKVIFGLETVDEQLKLFKSLPEVSQLKMLKDAIDHHDEMMRLKEAMVDAYLAEDMKKIEALENKSLADSKDSELSNWLRKHLIDERNYAMEKKLLSHLGVKSMLVSVGALHLIGEKGLLSLLEKDGYYITPVSRK